MYCMHKTTQLSRQITDIGSGLEYLHKMDVIHCDLKCVSYLCCMVKEFLESVQKLSGPSRSDLGSVLRQMSFRDLCGTVTDSPVSRGFS